MKYIIECVPGAQPRDMPAPEISSLSLSQDGSTATASIAGDICIFKMGASQITPIVSLRRAHNRNITSLKLNHSNDLISTTNGELRVWDLKSVVAVLNEAESDGTKLKLAKLSDAAIAAQQELEYKFDKLRAVQELCEGTVGIHQSKVLLHYMYYTT